MYMYVHNMIQNAVPLFLFFIFTFAWITNPIDMIVDWLLDR